MLNVLDMQEKFSISIQEHLGGILRSSGIEIPFEAVHSIGGLLHGLFSHGTQGSADVALKKAPKDFGDSENEKGILNVIPSTSMTRHITDTLAVFCTGSDNLNTRLADALIAVGIHHFKNVIFITSKWDSAAVMGSNGKRLQDLAELAQAGSRFCFVLVSTSGIGMIPVI